MNNNGSGTRISYLKGFIGFSLSSWVNAGLSLISTPITTRVFSTSELGKIYLFISIVNMFLNFSYLGIDQAFTRFYNEPLGKNDKKSFLTTCMIIAGIGMAGVMVGILIFGDWLSTTIIGYITFIIPVSLVISVIANMMIRFFNLAARMEKKIILFNFQAILTTIISNMSYVAVAVYKPTAEYAIVFRTIMTVFATIIFLIIALKKSMSFKVDISRGVVKNILLYALPVCPAAILAVANNSIGQILMKHYVDYSAIGIYSNAVTVAAIITIIQSGINSYWSPYVYENYKTKQTHIIKMHHIISLIIIMFAFAIIICEDIIYILLVGRDFWASKQIFPLLIISPVCYTVSETLGIGIRLSRKTFWNIPVYILNIIVNIGLCVVLLPKIGVAGAALASMISSVAMLFAKSILGEREYRCSDNYMKLIIAMGALISVAVIHMIVYESIFKYIIYIIGVIVVSMCYLSEIKSIFSLVLDLKKVLKR